MTKADKIVIGIVFALAIIGYIVFNFLVFNTDAETVVISVDGKEYAVYQLIDIKGTKEICVETEFGTNVIEMTNKSAKVIEASCPDKLDVKSGEIKKSGQVIVCLPNRLTVSLEGGKTQVDKVTY